MEELDQLIIDFNEYIADAVQRAKIEFSKSYANIVLSTAGKSLLIMRETLFLAAAGYPDGALSLSRNLYEQFVTLIFFEHEKQLEGFSLFVEDYYLDYEIKNINEHISAHEWIGDEFDLTGLRNELKEVKDTAHSKISGDYWWTGKPNFTRLAEYVLSNENDISMRRYIGLLHTSYKRACVSLHASCLGNILRLKDDAEPHIIDILHTNDRQYFPLWFATSSLILIFGVTCKTLGISHEPYLRKMNELALFYEKSYDRSVTQ